MSKVLGRQMNPNNVADKTRMNKETIITAIVLDFFVRFYSLRPINNLSVM